MGTSEEDRISRGSRLRRLQMISNNATALNTTVVNPPTNNTSLNVTAWDEILMNGTMFDVDFPSAAPSLNPSAVPTITPSESPTPAPTASIEKFINSNDAQIIAETFRLYGSLYLLFFFSFCFLRRKFPILFNVRSWVPEIRSELANTEYGFFNWAWRVFKFTDDELRENCGMDALCFLRCLRLGTKLSILGTCNSVWLIPLYYTAEPSPETELLTDPFVLMSVANVPIGSFRFIGTVLAAYIIVLTSMYLVAKEYDWFIQQRHKYLSQRKPRNYAVYVSGIPEEYRSSYALADYFRQCTSWGDSVFEAHIAMDIPSLTAKVTKRDKLVEKIEHTMALERQTGNKQTHHSVKKIVNGKGVKKVDSIQSYMKQLEKLNSGIALEVGRIRRSNHRMRQHLTRFQTSRNIAYNLDISDEEGNEGTPRLLKTGTSGQRTVATEDTVGTFGSMQSRVRRSANISPMDDFSDIEEGQESVAEEGANPSTSDESNIQRSGRTAEISTDGSGDRSRPDVSAINTSQDQVLAEPHPFLTVFGFNSNLFSPSMVNSQDGDASIEFVTDSEDDKEEVQQNRSSMARNVETVEDPDDLDAVDEISIESMGVIPELSDKSSELERVEEQNCYSRSSSGSGSAKPSNKWLMSDTLRSGAKIVSSGTSEVGHNIRRAGKVGATTVLAARTIAGSHFKTVTDFGLNTIQQAPDLGKNVGATIAASAAAVVPLRLGRTKGEPLDAGFVVFRDLYTAQAARQMLQHHNAASMLVEPAPDPAEIFWPNVGLPAQARKSGWLLSMFATSTLCFFWSIPMAFFSSLTEVSSLRQTLPRLGETLDAYPALESFLALIAPLLLLTLNESALPMTLKWFAAWEGHVGASLLEASLFVKLCAFVFIQTFFVSALSGTISAELGNFLDEPEEIVDLLANSLPVQSSYFIQICFVFTFLLHGLDLIRAYALGMAFLRRYFVGPRLTEKERRKKWGVIYSLEDPPEFWHAELLAQIMIFFVVFFVYSTLSPITSPFLLTCFVLLESGYRYHFVHNQKPTPDSGGNLWIGFVKVLLASMLIGQITLFGQLVLKRTVYALPTLAPLGIVTVLFIVFVISKRRYVATYLPTLQCVTVDKEFREAGDDVKYFASNEFLQPALKAKPEYPEGIEIPRLRVRTMSRDGTR